MIAPSVADQVVLVDEDDQPLGVAEKFAAHQAGLLHRAFSLIIQRSDGSVLLQRRSVHKYHSGGLWTNTCCSHPQPGESVVAAAKRRLREEMGLSCNPTTVGRFVYRAWLDSGLIEHEVDHVLVAEWDGRDPTPDPDEVMDWRWLSPARLRHELRTRPDWFTVWLTPALAMMPVRSPLLLETTPAWNAIASAS
jgi:isopentenyl-diphosphate delta-isomerase